MINQAVKERVLVEVDKHVRASKGYETESYVNPFVPVDMVASMAMAKFLTESNAFDCYVSVAPEGHVYGYFLEAFHGVKALSVHVDYPPRECVCLDDLSGIRGQRVLLLEDDVASGYTLKLVLATLKRFRPRSISLYLGRPKEGQVLENVPKKIDRVYLAEDVLTDELRAASAADLAERFGGS
ncbi:MAG: hypothetical protein KDA83_01810 [Planctomycetales bacterium]|nr:hypothetical protein [Planctomycetales bacterium]